ncbi:MAG: helix-turn-helix transcriptional regulator [Pseudomonadota bacterium]
MDDFASTALYNLIAARLRRAGMPAATQQRFAGKLERTHKSDLLNAALEELGPAAIVDIGQGLRDVHSDPTLNVLLAADTPGELLARWQRMERYYHGKHRVRVIASDASQLKLEHYATGPGAPTAGEDLVIAGVLAAALQLIGCRSLSLAIGDAGHALMAADRVVPTASLPPDTASWKLTWRTFERQRPPTALAAAASTLGERIRTLLRSDIGRGWRLADVAQQLNISRRSLQRALAGEGQSFQQLLRAVRAEFSAELLSAGEMGLAAAGYASGFADQAHFSRDFKLRYNMPPSAFVDLAQAS